MDTTPGRVCARATITDEEQSHLMAEGHCFWCQQKGHMSWGCPQKQQNSQAHQVQPDSSPEDTTIRTTKVAKLSPQKLLMAMTDLNNKDKDHLIQEAFMG